MTVSQASRLKTGKRSSTDPDSLISQGIRKQPGEKGSLVGLFPLTVQPDQQSHARFPGKEFHPPLCRITNDPYCGIGEIFSPPGYGRMGYRSRFGEARSRMGAHAAGDRLCPEFPTGQRLDMTGSLPRRRRRKLSRTPRNGNEQKNSFPEIKPACGPSAVSTNNEKEPAGSQRFSGFFRLCRGRRDLPDPFRVMKRIWQAPRRPVRGKRGCRGTGSRLPFRGSVLLRQLSPWRRGPRERSERHRRNCP